MRARNLKALSLLLSYLVLFTAPALSLLLCPCHSHHTSHLCANEGCGCRSDAQELPEGQLLTKGGCMCDHSSSQELYTAPVERAENLREVVRVRVSDLPLEWVEAPIEFGLCSLRSEILWLRNSSHTLERPVEAYALRAPPVLV